LLPTSPPITEAPGLPPSDISKTGESKSLNPGEVGGVVIGVLALVVITLNIVLYIRGRSSILDFGTPASRVRSEGGRTAKPTDNNDFQPTLSTATDKSDTDV